MAITVANDKDTNSQALHKIEIEGQVRDLDIVDSNGAKIIAGFRLACYDKAGTSLPPIPVKMTFFYNTRSISLTEGDRVRVFGAWKEDCFEAEKIKNLTTGLGLKRLPALLIIFLTMVPLALWFVWMSGIFWWGKANYEQSVREMDQSYAEGIQEMDQSYAEGIQEMERNRTQHDQETQQITAQFLEQMKRRKEELKEEDRRAFEKWQLAKESGSKELRDSYEADVERLENRMNQWKQEMKDKIAEWHEKK